MFRRLCALFLSLTMVSCAKWPPAPTTSISMETAAASVYKVEVRVKLDTSELNAMFPGLGIGDEFVMGSSGTAWVHSHSAEGRSSNMITAGHVCESGDTMDVGPPFGHIPVIDVTYKFIDAHGLYHTQAVVIADDDALDLCMVRVVGNLGTPIPMATQDPTYGADIRYIGAPKGHWGGRVALIFAGLFSGRGNPFKTAETYLTITVEGAPGASGSPVLHDGKAIGVLVAGARNFWNLIVAVPHDDVRMFADKALGR